MARKWNRNELILAFSLYCKIPFGKLHKGNPQIIQLSQVIDRTPSSVALKLVNFSSLDSELKKREIKGMSNCSKLDKAIFNEFQENWEQLFVESELIYEIYNESDISFEQEDIKIMENTEKIVKVKQRINQNFFRQMVLANYDTTCAVCSLNYSSLLIASHIIPWSKNRKERLNPHNGLCLCSIHDKAFDLGLITFDNNLRLIISKEIVRLNPQPFDCYFGNFANKTINIPQKFYPSLDFIKYHRQYIFKGQ